MADEEKQEQKHSKGEQAGSAAKTQTGAGALDAPTQGQQQPEDSSSDEQTGEGTGAKAGEYS